MDPPSYPVEFSYIHFFASLLYSLTVRLIFSSLSPHNLHLLFCCILSIFAWLLGSFVLCCHQKRFSLSSKIFLSHVLIFSCEISLVCHLKHPWSCFSSYLCFLVLDVLLDSGCCNESFFALFYVIFESSCGCIVTTVNVHVSSFSFFFWQIWSVFCYISDVRPYASPLAFLSSGSIVEVLTRSISRIVPRILQGDSPGVYFFDEISAAELDFESFLVRLRYSFLAFIFISTCLMVSASNIPKYW